jgi:hypothetical protein
MKELHSLCETILLQIAWLYKVNTYNTAHVVQCQYWRPFKYDENVKQSHQLDSETQQMHSINKWDIFFTYIVNIFWIVLLF